MNYALEPTGFHDFGTHSYTEGTIILGGPMRLRGPDMMSGNEGNFGNGWRCLMSGKAGIFGSLSGWTWTDGWCSLFIEWPCLCLCWVGLGASPGEWIGLSGKSLLLIISSTFDSLNDEGRSTKTSDPPPSLISKRGKRSCFVASVVTMGLMIPLLCSSLPVGGNVGVCVDAVVTVVVDKPFITRTFSTNSFLSYIVSPVSSDMSIKSIIGSGGGVDGHTRGLQSSLSSGFLVSSHVLDFGQVTFLKRIPNPQLFEHWNWIFMFSSVHCTHYRKKIYVIHDAVLRYRPLTSFQFATFRTWYWNTDVC